MNFNNSVWRTMALVTQLGISILSPVILCVYAGYFLDKKFGWHTLIPLMLLGLAAGVRSAYVLAKNAIRQNEQSTQKKEWEKDLTADVESELKKEESHVEEN